MRILERAMMPMRMPLDVSRAGGALAFRRRPGILDGGRLELARRVHARF